MCKWTQDLVRKTQLPKIRFWLEYTYIITRESPSLANNGKNRSLPNLDGENINPNYKSII